VDWGQWAPTAELGRLLWHEREALLQELAGLPEGQVDLDSFARRSALVGHRWPAVAANAGVAAWRRALWSAALAPLAMLGAVDVPALPAPTPAWFAVTATAPALLAAATAMTGPEAPRRWRFQRKTSDARRQRDPGHPWVPGGPQGGGAPAIVVPRW
jgi:hypothetical protein